MHNKKLGKIYAGCALSMALAVAAAPINALAAGTPADPGHVNTVNPGTTADNNKAEKEADATKRENLDPTAEDYADTVIDVWGYTEDGTVYSVDVEWGAMTFQYEASTWDPDSLKSEAGRGWLVYDNVNDKVLGDVQDAINRITVTNHSNASVYAKLTYEGAGDSGVSAGKFAAIDTAKQTKTDKPNESDTTGAVVDFNATVTITAGTDADTTDTGVIALETANNGQGTDGAGKPTVGNVYFMPKNIADAKKTADGISQWTTIGKITVSLSTEDPTPAP